MPHHGHHREFREHRQHKSAERTRSLSPRYENTSNRRSRSPVNHHHKASSRYDHEGHERKHKSSSSSKRHHRERHVAETLPFSARPLSKSDLPRFRGLFAYFLSVQKQIEWEDIDEREMRGRWKSFVGKWNRGELAEGWYDPDLFSRISEEDPGPPAMDKSSNTKAADEASMSRTRTDGHDISRRVNYSGDDDDCNGDGDGNGRKDYENDDDGNVNQNDNYDSDDDRSDDYGPTLPGQSSSHGRHAGPGIPSLADLSLRRELAREDREKTIEALRNARKADRALQKERLEDLAPQADAGTRERKLEKRQEVNAKMREFRDRRSPGMDEAANDKDLMGGGDSVEDYRRAKEMEKRKKTEREIRREEFDRAKKEEMEKKKQAWREREDRTISMLKDLAQQRFG